MRPHRLRWRVSDPGGEPALLAADLRDHLRLPSDDSAGLDDAIAAATAELEAKSGLSLCRRSVTATATAPADGSDWLPDAPADIALPCAPVASVSSVQLDGSDVTFAARGVANPGDYWDPDPVIRVTNWPSSPGGELVVVAAVGWVATDPGDTDADPATPPVVMPDAAAVPQILRAWLRLRAADRWMFRSNMLADVRVSRTFATDRILRSVRRWR